VTLVIVGTGTDVGKTVVAATLLARYGAEIPLAYWKPVATGARDGRDTATVEALAGDRAAILAESYLFDEPLSPHLAARLAGQRIVPAALLADFDRHRAGARTLVIETAGGLLVPLAEGEGVAGDAPGSAGGAYAGAAGPYGGVGAAGETRGWPFRQPPDAASPSHSPPPSPPLPGWRPGAAATEPAGAGYLQADLIVDMARRAALTCLVVARTGLGTINHTLLTLEALRARGLAVAAVVLDGPPNRENRRAIEAFGGVEPVLELPHLSPLDREEVAAAVRHFDQGGHLAPLLRLRRHLPSQADPSGQGSRGSHGSRGSGRGLRRGPPA
jgi:dethiobiotin synthase